MAQLGERNHRPGGRGHRQLAEPAELAAQRQRHLQVDEHRLDRAVALHVAEDEAAHRHLELAVDGLDRHAAPAGLFAVDHEAPGAERHLQVAVDVDGDLGALEQRLDVGGHLAAGRVIGAVDLGHHGLQHRRSGRHLDHLDARAQLAGDRREHLAGEHGELFGGAVAVVLGGQLDLDIGLPRPVAQVAVADQPIEIERTCRADVALQRHHLGDRAQLGGERVHHVGGHRQRRALGHVQGHVVFGLVVFRQHLHRHRLGREQHQRQHEHRHQADREAPAHRAPGDQRHQQAHEEPVEREALPVFLGLGLLQRLHRRTDALRQPGREDEGGEQREHHRHRAERRDRLHVRAHHAAHEAHRQQRRDHREGSEDRRVADFAHRVNTAPFRAFALLEPAPVDVFHHDDGVVDEDTDRENEREQRDPVDRVAQQPGREHRDQDDDRDHDQHHRRGPHPQRRPDQQRHRAGHHEQLEDQLVDLLVGGFTIVAGDLDMHVVGDQVALQPVDVGEHRIGHRNAVRAGFLRHRDGHGGGAERRGGHGGGVGPGPLLAMGAIGRAGVIAHHRAGVVGALGHQRHVADIGRLALPHADHQALDIACGAQERAGIERERALSDLDHAHPALGIGGGDGLGDLVKPNAKAGEALGEHLDLDRVGAAADDEALRRVRHFFQALHHVEPERPQRAFVDLVAPQRERDHRHVVDALGLDQRLAHAGRDAVEVGLDLVVELDEGLPHLFAHFELHRHHRAVALRRRVDVIDAGDLAHQPLQRVGGEARHLLRGDAGIGEEHIDHRHRDLRVFLPGCEDQPHDTEAETGQQQQRRERRIDERLGKTAREAEPFGRRCGGGAVFALRRHCFTSARRTVFNAPTQARTAATGSPFRRPRGPTRR